MDARQELLEQLESLCPSADASALSALLSEYEIAKPSAHTPGDILSHISHFLAAKRIEGLSEKTLANYHLYLGHFAACSCKNVEDITTDDIRDFLGSRQVKDTSLQTILNILRSFFAWLTVEETIPRNPLLKIKTPKRRKTYMRKYLSEEELERLRCGCKTPRERALLEFMYSSGCRVSEVAQLRLSDVDFAQRSAQVLGKGGKERMVCFSVKAKLLLEEYLHSRIGVSDWLFANVRAPFDSMCSRTMQRTLYALGQRAALPHRVHPHLLRHTFATLMLNRGMDITIIQLLLGHSQLSTTELYARVYPERIQQVYDRVVV